MFSKVLVANRGEIACRVIRTCRRMGVRTVAVYSEADAGARHVQMADEAWPIGPPQASASYLDMDKLLQVAQDSGADAVHPGYGFLSENAPFARRCAQLGIAFIGPDARTIELMGSKAESKKLMVAAGVPTVPGYHGDAQDEQTLLDEAAKIQFPLLVKASGGGGGKGMRIVHEASQLQAAIAGARREAQNAFGDDHLIIERFVERPRHIEFQVFGDSHGNIVHLFERECSCQRRYQKIVEETPSPFLDDSLRAAMAKAAVDAAAAVDYVNAGTVEFIVGEDRQFYFLEMNTRLQVEHPVTEAITGLDLVDWQLRVACGEPLPLAQEAITTDGHAIEARIYAERPADNFLPATGTIEQFVRPSAHGPASGQVRMDHGIIDGAEISVHYDPMIAKLICHDVNREQAIARLRESLARTAVFGLDTNITLLRRLSGHQDFAEGRIDTGYIDRADPQLLAAAPTPPAAAWQAAALFFVTQAQQRHDPTASRSPWLREDGWQLAGASVQRVLLQSEDGTVRRVSVGAQASPWSIRLDDEPAVTISAHSDAQRVAMQAGQPSTASHYAWLGSARHVLLTHAEQAWQFARLPAYAPGGSQSDDQTHPGSPMPGRIVAVQVAEGDAVSKGDALVVLEAMKMEFTVRARCDGTVSAVHYQVGDLVEAEVPLVDLTETQP